MQTPQEIVEKILNLKQQGLSQRQIQISLFGTATKKSTVNNVINRVTQWPTIPSREPKILLFDLETAPAIQATFGRFNLNLSQQHIIQEGGWILCSGYKLLGEENPVEIVFDIDDIAIANDFTVVANMWELFNQVDAVIAHNGKNFDVKMLQARCLFHGLPPLPSVKIIDTLTMARNSFRLPSNKLDSIASYLGLGRKEDTGGIQLWIDTMNGDQEALQKMLSYCKQDVNLLEKVYYRLRSFGHHGTTFNAAHYFDDDKQRCPVCGSDELTPRKQVYTAVSVFTEMVCDSCGAIHRDRTAINNKEKKKNILVPLTS